MYRCKNGCQSYWWVWSFFSTIFLDSILAIIFSNKTIKVVKEDITKMAQKGDV